MARQVSGLRKRASMVRRMDALTGPTHRDALRVASLAAAEGVTAASLATSLKATRAHALNILNELEAQGFLRGTPSRGKRKPGVATVYRIQPAKIDAALDELRAWITGAGAHVGVDRHHGVQEGGLTS